ncbi:hypothetical protein L1887_22925 [Cichorium endivia]|nr:hypothetical protein L1887_22925 [Cichorium endivia]
MNVKAFKEVEGIPNIELRYVGGLNTLLEFEDETGMQALLVKGEDTWRPWFKSLTPWNQDMQLNKRIASLLIYGVPLHAWCEEAFSGIARSWGKVLIPEACETDNLNMAFGRVGILTDYPGLISSSVNISVDEKIYSINVIEDLFESNRLNPMLACNDIESEFNQGDWASDWRSETQESDGYFAGSELPGTPQGFSPEKETSPGSSEKDNALGNEKSDQSSRRNSKSRHLSAQSYNQENTRELNEGVINGIRPSSDNNPAQEECQAGPDLFNDHEMGRKTLRKTKSLDLNAHPTQSLDSRVSSTRIRNTSPRSRSLSQSKNPADSLSQTISLSTSKELEATLELGKKIGFQFSGNNEQTYMLLRNNGDANVSQ